MCVCEGVCVCARVRGKDLDLLVRKLATKLIAGPQLGLAWQYI